MTPERTAALVAWWVRTYTRRLPAAVARRRVDEIDADLHDHIAHERRRGTDDRRIALGIAGRMVRGVAADLSWRGQTIARAATRKDATDVSRAVDRPVVRVGLVTMLILLVPLVGMLVTEEVGWSLFDFALAAVLLGGAGLLLTSLAGRRTGGTGLRVLAVAVGAAALVLGEADDAPGLGAFGLLLIGATAVLTFRTAQRSG